MSPSEVKTLSRRVITDIRPKQRTSNVLVVGKARFPSEDPSAFFRGAE